MGEHRVTGDKLNDGAPDPLRVAAHARLKAVGAKLRAAHERHQREPSAETLAALDALKPEVLAAMADVQIEGLGASVSKSERNDRWRALTLTVSPPEIEKRLPRLRQITARTRLPRGGQTASPQPARRQAAPRAPRARAAASGSGGGGPPSRRDDDPEPPPEPGLTALQAAQQKLLAAVSDARETLDVREHKAFVDFTCAVVAREAARHTNWKRRAA